MPTQRRSPRYAEKNLTGNDKEVVTDIGRAMATVTLDTVPANQGQDTIGQQRCLPERWGVNILGGGCTYEHTTPDRGLLCSPR